MTGLWRCFPYDARARAGEEFSPQFVPAGQTGGRFDLSDRPRVLYLAATPVHALAEALAPFRGRPFRQEYLRRADRTPLAWVEILTSPTLEARIADANDPRVLSRLGLTPAAFADHQRPVTQALARTIHAAGFAGFSWWSALTGAWRSTVLFEDRTATGELRYGAPRLVRPDDPEVAQVRQFLQLR